MADKGWVGLARAASDVFGWVYFLAWSLSFYPQPLLNWRRKSTVGLTVDFPLLNVLGFVCYTLSTTAFYFNEEIRHQYAIRNPGGPVPTVRANDVAFAVHALFLCAITYTQFWSWLWGFERTPGKRASRITQGIFCGCITGLLLVGLVVVFLNQDARDPQAWAGIDIIYAASYVKLIVTCVKYVPQAFSNFKAKSTKGWAIGQILLDLLGGILSISQLLIDSSLESDWSGVTGNPAKFGLGNISIFFDLIFITQHYVLYKDDREETRPLLG
ncbi:PQ loop repeat-domain-containing protein [Elsinoe ampelina]|uniref:PQ loop repeat-domain-containing protein n=1 Tax=Elsinoe ampelina TaxID=302913 RepID=A0A6A6GHN6_9PEZI|nr:PQ loop repeat-domain-containing protein [Elsinoe ampelina]